MSRPQMEPSLSSERYDMSCPIRTRRTTGCCLVGAEREAGGLAMDATMGASAAIGVLLSEDGSVFEWGASGATIDGEPAAVVSELPLRCVSSGSLDGCSCRSRIAKAVVVRAWARELEASGDREARFFHFIS